MGAPVLHSSSRLSTDAQIKLIKLIKDAPFSEPSFSCLSKVSVNEPPPGSPTGAHMERVTRFRSLLFNVSLIPHTISLDKKEISPSIKVLGKERPSMFPRMGPLWKQTPISRALLNIPFGVPSKEPSFQVPLMELSHREMLRFQSPPSFIFQNPPYTSSLPSSPSSWAQLNTRT
jgi:hypothetical protein